MSYERHLGAAGRSLNPLACTNAYPNSKKPLLGDPRGGFLLQVDQSFEGTKNGDQIA